MSSADPTPPHIDANESASDASRDAADRSDADLAGARPPVYTLRGVSFALLAHPTVQAIRFASKLALPWFVTTSQYGEAALAGLVMFGVQHVAVFGLDDALISAVNIDARLVARMRRTQTWIGVALAVLVAGVGALLQLVPDQARLGLLLMALAPMTIVANLATLPTALLVRERCYARIFAVDLIMILTLTTVSISSAVAGLGEWSLVLAWHANAVAALIAASLFAKPLYPRHSDGGDDFERVRTNGAHLTGAAVSGYLGERIDGGAVGFGLGRAALGLYDWASNQSQFLVNYAASLSERLLFPTFAAQHRAGELGAAYLQVLRITLVVVLPLHVLLAVMADPIVRTLSPEQWHGAAPLLALLALGAGARCVDVAAVTALKAAGRGRAVFRLGLARIAGLLVAILFALPHGVVMVAGAVLASRIVAALVSLVLVSRRLDLGAGPARRRLVEGGRAAAVWVLVFVPVSWYLERILEGASVPMLALVPLVAFVLWFLVRTVVDRAALTSELGLVRARLERPGAGGGG